MFAVRLGHKIRPTTDTSIGPTANVLIVDEAALVKDPVYFSVSPATARTHGDIWLMSTPRRPQLNRAARVTGRSFGHHAYSENAPTYPANC